MSNASQFYGGLKRKFQYFSASGTFYPTQAMLDAGGVLELDIRGGGGGMSVYDGERGYTPGGNSKHKTFYQLLDLTSITVTIGAGGSSGQPGTAGGSTSFGTLTVPGGARGENGGGFSGMGSGNEGSCNQQGFRASNQNWNGQVLVYAQTNSAWAGSGMGGGYSSSSGASGSVLVSWFERG